MANEPIQRQPSKHARTARYVVYVDNQAKSSFDSRDVADQEARRILAAFPILTVRVADSENDSATALGPTRDADEAEET